MPHIYDILYIIELSQRVAISQYAMSYNFACGFI